MVPITTAMVREITLLIRGVQMPRTLTKAMLSQYVRMESTMMAMDL
jgi:hypothetical protein